MNSLAKFEPASLALKKPTDLRDCRPFAIIPDRKPSERLSAIRHHPGPEDWLSQFGDHEVLSMIDEMIEYSRQLREDAEARGIPYFEDLGDFGALKERVLYYLETGQA